MISSYFMKGFLFGFSMYSAFIFAGFVVWIVKRTANYSVR